MASPLELSAAETKSWSGDLSQVTRLPGNTTEWPGHPSPSPRPPAPTAQRALGVLPLGPATGVLEPRNHYTGCREPTPLVRGGRLCQGTAPPQCTLRLTPLRTLKGYVASESSGKPMKTSVYRPPGKAEGRKITEQSVPREHSANKQMYFIMEVNRLGHAPLKKLNLKLPGAPEVRPSSPTAWALLTWCSPAKPTQVGLNTPWAGRASPFTQQDRGDAACPGMECKLASGSRPWPRTLATRLPCRTAGV